MRVLSLVLRLVALSSAACQPAPPEPRAQHVQAERLVLATYEAQHLQLHAVDPTTLEDVPDLPALEPAECSSAGVVQPQGRLLAVLAEEGACGQNGGLVVRLL